MAITVYPLNNIDFTAEDVAIYNSTRTSGIYAGDDFAISLTGSDNTISVDAGLAWMRLSKFNGVAVALKAKTSIDMGIPDAAYPRIDALVLQFDANKNGAELVPKLGTASSNPQPPAVSQTEALYELHLLHVLRQPGAASITAADVTDLRLNKTYCGLMADSVTRIDLDGINAQASALIEQLRQEIAGVKDGSAYPLKSGDTMTGPLNLPAPTQNAHAVNKGYVDTKTVTITLLDNGWTGDTAPYTQSVEIDGLTDEKFAKAYPAWPEALADKLALAEETAKVRAATRSGSTMTFECWEDKPTLDIPVVVEVYV